MSARWTTTVALHGEALVAAMRVFEAALDEPGGARRDAIVRAAGDDAPLRDAALALLAAHDASTGFLEPDLGGERIVGAYRLVAPIGAGGMGRVWLAQREDGAFEQRVAVKVLASVLGDPDALRRAAAERQFLAWVDHPNIARVLDGGVTATGQPYVVMEYVDGQRIDDWCREAGLDPAARVRLFLQVVEAIDAAHRALIIHRDIKPANVLVTSTGVVKLLDFGIAKSLDGRIGGDTRTGLTPLTPAYASPEQLAGAPLTTASDVYALGLLLRELLTGKPAQPEAGRSAAQLAREIALQPTTRTSEAIDADALGIAPRAVPDWRRRIAGDLDRVIGKAIAPEPQRRYASARAFADDLARWLDHRPVVARAGGAAYRFGKFVRRHVLAVTASAAALVALAVGLSVAAVQARRAADEGERAMRANRFLTQMIANADPYTAGKAPLLVDALDRAVRDIPQAFAGQPLLEADIRRAIGHAYRVLERNDDARVQLDRAAALRAGTGGTDYAAVLGAQAVLDWQLGRYDDAERRFREGLAQCADDARGRAQRAELLNDWSSMLSSLGRSGDALSMAREAQALRAALPDVAPRDVAVGIANVAAALDGLGRFDESHAAYRDAIARLEAIVPLPQMELSITLNNFAYLQNEMGQVDAAIASQERALALRIAVVGPDFPRNVALLSNLAQQYAKVGRLDEARATMADALRLAPLAFAPDDQSMGNLYVGAARVALARGEREAARDHARAALAIYDRAQALEPGRREKALELLRNAAPP